MSLLKSNHLKVQGILAVKKLTKVLQGDFKKKSTIKDTTNLQLNQKDKHY